MCNKEAANRVYLLVFTTDTLEFAWLTIDLHIVTIPLRTKTRQAHYAVKPVCTACVNGLVRCCCLSLVHLAVTRRCFCCCCCHANPASQRRRAAGFNPISRSIQALTACRLIVPVGSPVATYRPADIFHLLSLLAVFIAVYGHLMHLHACVYVVD